MYQALLIALRYCRWLTALGTTLTRLLLPRWGARRSGMRHASIQQPLNQRPTFLNWVLPKDFSFHRLR
jgi:hypothetical protein